MRIKIYFYYSYYKIRKLYSINKESKEVEEFIVNTSDETENDIDKDSLEMVVIGNKKYLMDYNKGFIYDTKFNIVGNIDEFGNPNIN